MGGEGSRRRSGGGCCITWLTPGAVRGIIREWSRVISPLAGNETEARMEMLLVADFADPKSIRVLQVAHVTRDDVVTTDGEHYMAAFCFPADMREQVMEVVNKRAALKKALEDSLEMVYSLRNEVARRK